MIICVTVYRRRPCTVWWRSTLAVVSCWRTSRVRKTVVSARVLHVRSYANSSPPSSTYTSAASYTGITFIHLSLYRLSDLSQLASVPRKPRGACVCLRNAVFCSCFLLIFSACQLLWRPRQNFWMKLIPQQLEEWGCRLKPNDNGVASPWILLLMLLPVAVILRTRHYPFGRSVLLVDRTNGRGYATVLRPSSSLCRLWRYVLWLNGAF